MKTETKTYEEEDEDTERDERSKIVPHIYFFPDVKLVHGMLQYSK